MGENTNYDDLHIYQQQFYILLQGAGVEEVDAETFVENLPGGFSLSSSTISLVINFTFGLVFPLPFFLYKKGLVSRQQKPRMIISISKSSTCQAMSATENLIVDCLASNPGSKDFTSYQHVVQLLSE